MGLAKRCEARAKHGIAAGQRDALVELGHCEALASMCGEQRRQRAAMHGRSKASLGKGDSRSIGIVWQRLALAKISSA